MTDYKRTAMIFKAFCDENRLKILETLETGEKCACTLLEELTIAQSTLSHHMKILVDSTMVTSRKEGKWTYYALSEDGAAAAKALIDTIMTRQADYTEHPVCGPCKL